MNLGYMRLLQNWAALYLKPTGPENSIEPHIAALGVRYRAQHLMPGASAILDFALLDQKIDIEIDGKDHKTVAGKIKDAARTQRLGKMGWTVIRIPNEEALAAPKQALASALAGFPDLVSRLEAQDAPSTCACSPLCKGESSDQ